MSETSFNAKCITEGFSPFQNGFFFMIWGGSIPLKLYQILETIFSIYLGYVENDGDIYFSHKCMYLLQENISFR